MYFINSIIIDKSCTKDFKLSSIQFSIKPFTIKNEQVIFYFTDFITILRNYFIPSGLSEEGLPQSQSLPSFWSYC